jgi:hypothetical protein
LFFPDFGVPMGFVTGPGSLFGVVSVLGESPCATCAGADALVRVSSGIRNGAANITQPSTTMARPGVEKLNSMPGSFTAFWPLPGLKTSSAMPATSSAAPSAMKRYCTVCDMRCPQAAAPLLPSTTDCFQ